MIGRSHVYEYQLGESVIMREPSDTNQVYIISNRHIDINCKSVYRLCTVKWSVFGYGQITELPSLLPAKGIYAESLPYMFDVIDDLTAL